MNQAVSEVVAGSGTISLPYPGGRYYLTRFMEYATRHYTGGSGVDDPASYLEFLTWFALDCVPAWNLPRAFLPADLLCLLNSPIRKGLPLSVAMLVNAVTGTGHSLDDACSGSDGELVAIAFEQVPKLLRAGDPRLLPEYVSRFWNRNVLTDGDSLNAFEYVAAKALMYGAEPRDVPAVREWLAYDFLATEPEAAVFVRPAMWGAPQRSEGVVLEPPKRTVCVYRDHRTIAGLSKAGLEIREALAGAPVRLADFDFSFGRERIHEECTHNGSQYCDGKKVFHIVALNPEYVPECLISHLAHLREEDYVIGHFYWELSDTGVIHDCGLSLVDEIWVASSFLKSVYEKRVSVPVYVVGQAIVIEPVDPRFTKPFFGLPDDAYLFLCSFDAGSVIERKNPLAAVQAFRKAFPAAIKDVTLVLKTRNAGNLQTDSDRAHWRQVLEIANSDARIRIIDETYSREKLHGLHDICDCYISLHRSEGFGFGPAEAMSFAKPVITTGYSGVIDFCTQETALLVDYKLESVPRGAYPFMDDARQYHWASPDIDHAAQCLRLLYDAPERGRSLGRAGLELIRKAYSSDALRERCLSRLIELGGALEV